MLFSKKNKLQSLISKAQTTYDKAMDIFFESGNQDIRTSPVLLSYYQKALAQCNKAIDKDPVNLDALNLKTSILISLKKNGEALKVIELILNLEPENIAALFNKACLIYDMYNDKFGCKKILQIISTLKIEKNHKDYSAYNDALELLEGL